MTIKEIAHEINNRSSAYEIGKLQTIRKNIKRLKRRPSSSIFHDETINNNWAFHYGGRKEIQFNIGNEDEGLRYGLAFSLEPSQSLPDPSILYPKIFKLNCLIREQPAFFYGYKLWYWKDGERSDFMPITTIENTLLTPNIFIFLGKIYEKPVIDFDEILQTFDKLLEIYTIVETDYPIVLKYPNQVNHTQFIFCNNERALAKRVHYSTIEREINVDIRHSYLQEILQKQLEVEYGEENVSIEHPFNGNRIDIVVRHNKEFYFYEVKTSSSAKSCTRQAIGQLLEYAYSNGTKNASKIYIASEYKLDEETNFYLSYLREEFKIPIYYKKIDIGN